jgi:hypothetical protein
MTIELTVEELSLLAETLEAKAVDDNINANLCLKPLVGDPSPMPPVERTPHHEETRRELSSVLNAPHVFGPDHRSRIRPDDVVKIAADLTDWLTAARRSHIQEVTPELTALHAKFTHGVVGSDDIR